MRRRPLPVACRAAKNKIWEFKIATASKEKWFFAKNKLCEYLDKDKIQNILDCECSVCEQDRRDCEPKAVQYVDSIAGDTGKGSILLFGLLVHLGRPQFIANFMRLNWSDESFIGDLTRWHSTSPQQRVLNVTNLETEYWPELRTSNPSESNDLAVSFTQAMYMFAVPSIDSDQFYDFSSETRLPFINEKILPKKGSSATVYAFEIEPSYRSQKFAEHVTKFVRKEITDPDIRRSFEEFNNLKTVKKLNDPHIVDILKAYRHGEAFNIVFPHCPSDLDTRLREDDSRPESSHSIGTRADWQQFLGVLKAINRMGGPKNSSDSTTLQLPSKPMMLGYHFDLKPANILISSVGQWLVTDFGQAYFKAADGNTSRVRGQGGTDAYAPPENDDDNVPLGRKYDVWSLGCIFLELILFAIGGSLDVRELDNRRTTREQHGVEHRYWEYARVDGDARRRRPILKRAVVELVEEKIENVHPTSSKNFLDQLWAIARQMLEPELDDRADLDHIVREFEEVLKGVNIAQEEITPRMQHKLLKNRRFYVYSSGGKEGHESVETKTVTMNTEWSEQGELRIRLDGIRYSTRYERQFARQSYMFVPLYGYLRDRTDPLCHAHFYFSHTDMPNPNFGDCQVFAVDTRKVDSGSFPDAFMAQEACTGQRVIFNGAVKSFHYRSPGFQGFDKWIGKKAKSTGQLPATTIAIWKYKASESDPTDMGLSVPVHRLIIFSERSLYTFKITKEWTLDRKASANEQLIFRPTDDTAAPTFSGSVLRPPTPGPHSQTTQYDSKNGSVLPRGISRSSSEQAGTQGYSGIRLDPQHFINAENEFSFDMNKLIITFRNDEEATVFRELYLKVKEIHKEHRETAAKSSLSKARNR